LRRTLFNPAEFPSADEFHHPFHAEKQKPDIATSPAHRRGFQEFSPVFLGGRNSVRPGEA
jgi:hypothetical protein